MGKIAWKGIQSGHVRQNRVQNAEHCPKLGVIPYGNVEVSSLES
jgi:hypothetical protein